MKNMVGIIVTYNRKEKLLENIKSLLNQTYQLSLIYIIDNHGDDGTREFLEKNNINFNNIKYFYLEKNIGGAGGFNFGLKQAFIDGYDWFILMDDDGRPYDDYCFEKMNNYIKIKKYNKNDKIFLNSLVINNDETLSFGLGHLETISEILESKILDDDFSINNLVNPFNGTLISRGLINEIGYPNGEFFIKGDEVDYCLRAKKADAIVKTIYESRYFHPRIKNRKKINILNRKMYVFIEDAWKEYYNVRNYVYSVIHNEKDKRVIFKKIYLYKVKRIFCALVCKCKKIMTITMIIKGFKDGKKGNLGANVFPNYGVNKL